MESTLAGLERFLGLGIGLAALGLAGVALYGLLWLRRMSLGLRLPEKGPPLPKHKLKASQIDASWPNDEPYDRMLTDLHQSVWRALVEQDQETLEVLAQGPGLQTLTARLRQIAGEIDRREVLQGSVRERWDESTQGLVLTLALARGAGKGWRRVYGRGRAPSRLAGGPGCAGRCAGASPSPCAGSLPAPWPW